MFKNVIKTLRKYQETCDNFWRFFGENFKHAGVQTAKKYGANSRKTNKNVKRTKPKPKAQYTRRSGCTGSVGLIQGRKP